MNGLPQRRINRLSGFMYGGGNTYFLTICTQNRQHLLGEVVEGTPSPTNQRIPALISTLKRLTNRRIGRPIWQRSYYDHVVRNQADFDEILRYIQNNPAAWTENR